MLTRRLLATGCWAIHRSATARASAASRVLAYYVKATNGARVTVSCTKWRLQADHDDGKGAKRVRITRLNHRSLKNGTKITIVVSMPGRLTTTVTDTISRGRRVEGRPRCSPVAC